jgi:Protein of unknown function (DUF3618)
VSSSGAGHGVPEVTGPSDPEAILADIAATREQLARTVDELSHRLDVPARARERVEHVRQTALDVYLKNPRAVLGGGLALVAMMVGVVVWRSKHTSSRRKR